MNQTLIITHGVRLSGVGDSHNPHVGMSNKREKYPSLAINLYSLVFIVIRFLVASNNNYVKE